VRMDSIGPTLRHVGKNCATATLLDQTRKPGMWQFLSWRSIGVDGMANRRVVTRGLRLNHPIALTPVRYFQETGVICLDE
jgi:hypothetical protein